MATGSRRSRRPRGPTDLTQEIMTTDNPATRAQFEAKARTRFVVVLGDGSKQIYPTKVTAFHMRGYLTVVDPVGRSHTVRLEHVVEDAGWAESEPSLEFELGESRLPSS